MFATNASRQQSCLLGVRSTLHEGRAGDAQIDDDERAELAEYAFLLLPDQTLHGRCIPATVALGPVNARPASVVFAFLPVLLRRYRIDTIGKRECRVRGPLEPRAQLVRRVGFDPT